MGRDVLGVDRQRAAVGGDRLLQVVEPLGARRRLLHGPGVESERQLVDHLVIEAEVESCARGSWWRAPTRKLCDRLVEIAVAGVDLAGEPVDDPGRGRLLVLGGLLEGGQGVGDAAFLLIDAARLTQPSAGPARRPSGRPARPASARLSGLPCRLLRAAGRCRSRSSAARPAGSATARSSPAGPPSTGKLNLVARHHDDRQLRALPLAEDVVDVGAVELAVVDLRLERDRAGLARGHLEAEVDDLAGARRDLLVVERDEDVLRVAAVDPVAVAVEHVDVDEVRDRDRPSRPGPIPPERPMTRSAGAGDQLDPDLVGVDGPLAERVADAEGPDHDLDQVLACPA